MRYFPRLSHSTLDALAASVEQPRYSRRDAGIGHVHIGVGAFMRAHIAAYNDEAMNQVGGDWCIAGVSLRRGVVRDLLRPQDGLYHIAVCDSATTDYRLIGSIKSVDAASDDPEKIVRLLADPNISIVTLTVTENGYGIAPDSGALDASRADIAYDLVNLHCPQSTLGFLVAGLMRRRDDGGGPITILSCDNVPQNGSRLRNALVDFVGMTCADLHDWVNDNVRFPESMVDRIVPATTNDDVLEGQRATGVEDAALVRTEPFTQWVIEDNFAGPRPAWDAAGALFVDSVAPYESAKLRLLNGAHSALAYLGYLGGYSFVHEVLAAPGYAAYLRHMMTYEISPVTPEPEGMAHDVYIDALLARFSNTALHHRTWQIAMDGSQKLPQRLLNTVREQLERDGPIAGLSLAVAAWMRYALGTDERGASIDVLDPLAPRFAGIARRTTGNVDAIVKAFVGMDSVFGDDLPGEQRFVSAVTEHFADLLQYGAKQVVADFVAGARAP